MSSYEEAYKLVLALVQDPELKNLVIAVLKKEGKIPTDCCAFCGVRSLSWKPTPQAQLDGTYMACSGGVNRHKKISDEVKTNAKERLAQVRLPRRKE